MHYARGSEELRLPEWLMQLFDIISEQLPNEEARNFVSKFLAIISVGADVEPVKHCLAIRRIDRLLVQQRAALVISTGQAKAAITRVISALESIRSYHESQLSGKVIEKSASSVADLAWLAAAEAQRARGEAAWSAADSASSAAWSATESLVSSAAWSAADSVWSVADSAQSAAWKQEADDLLGLLAAAQMHTDTQGRSET